MIIEWISRLSVQPDSLRTAARSTRLPALLLGAQGFLNLIWAVIPDGVTWPRVLGRYTPLFWDTPGRLFNLVLAAGLIVLAGGLRRRKMYAWWMALILYTLSAGLHFASRAGFDSAAPWLAPMLLSLVLAGSGSKMQPS